MPSQKHLRSIRPRALLHCLTMKVCTLFLAFTFDTAACLGRSFGVSSQLWRLSHHSGACVIKHHVQAVEADQC